MKTIGLIGGGPVSDRTVLGRTALGETVLRRPVVTRWALRGLVVGGAISALLAGGAMLPARAQNAPNAGGLPPLQEQKRPEGNPAAPIAPTWQGGQGGSGQSILGGRDDSGQGVPGQGVPGQGVPGQSVPGQGVPGQGVPGQSVPGQSVPGQIVPGQSVLDGQRGPGQSILDGSGADGQNVLRGPGPMQNQGTPQGEVLRQGEGNLVQHSPGQAIPPPDTVAPDTGDQAQSPQAAPVAPPAPIERPNAWVPAAVAKLQALDKVDAQAKELTIRVGQTARFGSLTIAVKSCMIRPPNLPADAAAYLAVTDSHPDQPGFDGWMLQDEPSVSMMQHPIYDLRVTGCA